MMQTSLGHKLRLLRAERQMSLRQAAAQAGLAKETISEVERGLAHPHDVTLAKLAKAYDVPLEELLEEPEPAVPLAEAPREESGPKVVTGSMHAEVDARTFAILAAVLTGEVYEVIDGLADGELSREEAKEEAKERLERVLEPAL
jgi:transcriptional regulator with XRE-family HTH domain